MTNPPAFTPWTAPTNDNRLGSLLWGGQDQPGTWKAPTHFMKETGGGKFLPDFVTTEDKYFAGSLYAPRPKYQGAGYDSRSANIEMDPVTLALSCIAMWGPADPTSKIITPNGVKKWSQDLVTAGLSMNWYQPTTGHVYVTDAQLYELDISVPQARETITGTFMFHGRKAEFVAEGDTNAAYTSTAPIVPPYAGSFGRLDNYIRVNGETIALDGTSTLKMVRPVDPLAPQGEYTAGYKPGTGNISLDITATMNGGRPDLVGLMRGTTIIPVTFGLKDAAGNGVEFAVQGVATAVETPLQAGAVTTNITLSAKSAAPGVVPFTMQLFGDIPTL